MGWVFLDGQVVGGWVVLVEVRVEGKAVLADLPEAVGESVAGRDLVGKRPGSLVGSH